jgi:hypothetical protein
MVWLGSMRPLPEHRLANPQVPDPVRGYQSVEEVPAGEPVRSRFSLPHVAYVGSHEGCGCGFNSELAWEGFETQDALAGLLEALEPEERARFDAGQWSRLQLRALVEGALADGPVEVFGCWAGDETLPARAEEAVTSSHFTDHLSPIAERVLLHIQRP